MPWDMPLESPYYYNPAVYSYTFIIRLVVLLAGFVILYRGRVLRGVVLLLIGAVIIPLAGMQEWELSVRSDLTQPIPLAGIIPIALAFGIAYLVSIAAEPILRILAVLTLRICRMLFLPLPTYNNCSAVRAAVMWGVAMPKTKSRKARKTRAAR
jgi:hypothetical protein